MAPRVAANGTLQTLAALHRWIAVLALLLLLMLAVSGVLLNHAAGLGLDKRYVAAGWLLDWYGIDAVAPKTGFKLGPAWISEIDGRIYLNLRPVADDAGELIGAARTGGAIAVAVRPGLLLLDEQGERIDLVPWPKNEPPPALGSNEASDVFAIYAGESYRLTGDLMTWEAAAVEPLRQVAAESLDRDVARRLAVVHRINVLTWERALLDLHAGRLFGGAGPWLIDLAAFVILFLAVSGLWSWQVHRKRQRELLG